MRVFVAWLSVSLARVYPATWTESVTQGTYFVQMVKGRLLRQYMEKTMFWVCWFLNLGNFWLTSYLCIKMEMCAEFNVWVVGGGRRWRLTVHNLQWTVAPVVVILIYHTCSVRLRAQCTFMKSSDKSSSTLYRIGKVSLQSFEFLCDCQGKLMFLTQ